MENCNKKNISLEKHFYPSIKTSCEFENVVLKKVMGLMPFTSLSNFYLSLKFAQSLHLTFLLTMVIDEFTA